MSLVVELVQGLDDHELVLAADVVLDNGIQLGTDDDVERLRIGLERKIEAAVLVSLGCRGVGLLGCVVEGVLVGHVTLGSVGLEDGLDGEYVVDVGGLLHQWANAVESVLVALGVLHGCIGGVLVNGDSVNV